MSKEKGQGTPQEQEMSFFDREQQQIYNIITGKIRYKPQPFRNQDLHPDLIMKIRVPKSQYIPRGKHQSLSNFIPAPSQKLERVYTMAEKQIYRQMEINKENLDPHNIQIRLRLALHTVEPSVKEVKLINENEEEELMELECINKTSGLIDAFTIQYNAIIYTLQKVCGFRVKAFVLYGKDVEERDIYLFLNMNTDNLLRVANRYRIKKEVDYTFLDFYLNDPTTRDGRPIKFNSKFKSDKHSVVQQKHMKRHFKVKEGQLKQTQIVEELDLSDKLLQNYRSCNEQLHLVYDFIKYKQHFKLSKQEKTYIFEYNRRKINPGVEKLFHTIKKRREYFDISKEILPKYGYKVWDEPTVFEEFSLPDKNSKGATFFNKFESIMFYKPLVVTKEGDLSLFLNMERTKLAYMLIKKTFKVNYLSNIGVDIFPMENNFQKQGSDTGLIRGGIDGECLIDKWNFYSLFSDYKVIRNYFGQKITYEILSNNYIISYLLSIFIPYIFLQIIEQIFSSKTYIITTPIQALIFTISYSILVTEWREMQGQFTKNYCDPVQSKIFLSKFRGAYKRNVVTDELNEFQSQKGLSKVIRNLICFLMLFTLGIILGSIFYGFRMMIVEIYEPLQGLVVVGDISFPHIIAYSCYFIFSEMFRLILAEKIISVLVFLQNPPSDEDERQWSDTLSFFYLLIIDMIPPVFLLILQPFSGTSCYNDSCTDQLCYYVYAKYIFTFAVLFVRLIKVLVLNYLKNKLKELIKKEKHEEIFYQDRLTTLLKRAVEDSKKPEHKQDKMSSAVSLMNYAVYCCVVPLSPAIMLISIFIHFTNLRMALLFDERRPVNKSESIIKFTKQIMYIYYLGVIFNSWINIYMLETVENYFQFGIEGTIKPPTEQGVFLVKFFTTIIFGLIIMVIGTLAGSLAHSISNNALNNRKDNKLHEYKTSRGGLKIILKKSNELIPLKSIFRVYNPEYTSSQLLEEEIYNNAGLLNNDSKENNEEGEDVGSATNIAKNI